MTNRTLSVFTVGLVLCSIGIVVGSASSTPDKTLAEIAGYRQWTRVTPAPVPIAFSSPAG